MIENIRNNPIVKYIVNTVGGFLLTIANLLRSRKYLISISMVLTMIIVAKIPALAPFVDFLFVTILTAGLTTIGGIAYEDAAKTAKATPPPTGTPTELVERIVNDLIQDTTNPLGEEHRAVVTQKVEAQVVSKTP